MLGKTRTGSWATVALACCMLVGLARAQKPWALYRGSDGPGRGERIVLISGDEEYRSEQALPQLGKILARHHGFDCAVLFAVDPATGTINPNVLNNIPGLASLEDADLMIIFTRFRALPTTVSADHQGTTAVRCGPERA